MTKHTFMTIDEDWIIESGIMNDGSNRTYHYLLHKHEKERSWITVPNPTDDERICTGCNTRVPPHLAGFLILCRWER